MLVREEGEGSRERGEREGGRVVPPLYNIIALFVVLI